MASRRATSLRRASALVSTSCGFGSGQVEIWFGGVNVLGGGGRRSANERRQYLVRHRARVEGRHHRLVLRLDPVAGVDQQQRAAQHVHAAGLEIGEAHLGGRCVGWVGEVSRGCRGKGYARMKRPIQEAHPLTSIHRSRSASGALRCVCGGGGGGGRWVVEEVRAGLIHNDRACLIYPSRPFYAPQARIRPPPPPSPRPDI